MCIKNSSRYGAVITWLLNYCHPGSCTLIFHIFPGWWGVHYCLCLIEEWQHIDGRQERAGLMCVYSSNEQKQLYILQFIVPI
jgi:hypothetical protein